MADGGEEPDEAEQKKEIAKWFLANAPACEILYVAKDLRSVIGDDSIFDAAAREAFPVYNKAHLVSLEMPDRSGDTCVVILSEGSADLVSRETYWCKVSSEVVITAFGELDENNYFDPRTAQVATVDHIKQMCTSVRPATDEELPSAYVEEFRVALDVELCKYVGESYPKGICAVYSTGGKDVEGPGADFEFALVITAAKHSPHNFCNGSWRSIWNVEFKDNFQVIEVKGKMQVVAHYFEEGNVQLDTNHECKDSTIFQAPEDSAISIINMIRHHEAEYIASLEASYSKLPDTTFKDLRRKLPVTRTLFPWHSALQFSLNRDMAKELKIPK